MQGTIYFKRIIASLYDDAVERIVLTQENFIFFIQNVFFFPKYRFQTARRVIIDRMTSTEPWEKRKVKKSSFPSLQVLITLIFEADPCKSH